MSPADLTLDDDTEAVLCSASILWFGEPEEVVCCDRSVGHSGPHYCNHYNTAWAPPDDVNDDTEDEGFDDDTEDEGFDDDTEDDALDDDDHHEGCMCLECSQAEVVGLATVAADDPEGYLATFGAEGRIGLAWPS